MRTTAALALLLANGVTDLRKREILPVFTIALGGAGLLFRIASADPGMEILLCLCPGALFLLLSRITRGQVGGGDGLVVLALGAWLSAPLCHLAVFLSLGMTALIGAPALLTGRRKDLPFVPVLLAGTGLAHLLL